MKRMIARLAILLTLSGTGFFLYSSPQAAVISCWEKAYNKWTTCDGAYSNTKNTYSDRSNYCSDNASNTCSSSSSAFCTTQANNACSNDPNPQQCFNNQYNSCYLSQYQSCHTQTTADCLTNVQNAYDNRNNSYSTCLGIEGNYGNCVEELAFSCVDAQNRASDCYTVFGESDDGGAQSTCRTNSGVDNCQ